MAVRKISIDLTAGTASFLTDMDKANAKLTQFGQRGIEGGRGVTSGMAASSAAVRLFEGNLSVRAVERFLGETLKLGPALTAAFPYVGALIFAGVLFETGEKVLAFRKKILDLPEKISGAFRDLQNPLKRANDELQVTNDRLANDIAKLEGKHQNTLRLALDEARVAADRLADSLDKDLSGLNKLLKENNISGLKGFLSIFTTGHATIGTSSFAKKVGGETGYGGYTGEIDALTSKFQTQIDALNPKSPGAAQDANRIRAAARAALDAKFNQIIKDIGDDLTKNQMAAAASPGGANYSALTEEQQKALRVLAEMKRGIGLQFANEDLTGQKETLEANKANLAADQKARKEAYDRMLADMEASETLMASEKLAFRENELRELLQEGKKYKDLTSELQQEIGRLSQESFKEAKEIRDKDAKEQLAYLEKLAMQALEWQKRAADLTKEGYDRLTARKPTEPRPDIPQTVIEGDAATRLAGTPVGNVLKVETAGYTTVQMQQEAIANEQRLLAAMQQGGYTLGQQLEVRKKILEMQYALNEAISGREAQDALYRVQVEELLRLGSIKDGWDAFWISMNEQAEKPGKILYDGMHSALDKLSADAAKLLTDPKQWKGSNIRKMFGQTFHTVGEQMVESSVKSMAQTGLGKLGTWMSGKGGILGKIGGAIAPKHKADGQTEKTPLWVKIADSKKPDEQQSKPDGSALDKALWVRLKPDGTPGDPFYVIIQGIAAATMPPPPIGFGLPSGVLGGGGGGFSQTGTFPQPSFGGVWPPGGSGAPPGGGGPKGSGASSTSGFPGRVISLIGFGGGGWGGGGGGGGGTEVDSSVSYGDMGDSMADGGPVSAGMAYEGPHGIEAFIPHTSGTIIPESDLRSGGDNYHTYHVDARGADAGTEQRLRRALEETHRAAVSHSIQAGNDLKNRTPKR